MKITLCIPLYNEESIVADTVQQAVTYLDSTFGTDYELLMIDDGSKDGSLSVLQQYESERVHIITYQPNRGKGYAVRQGMLQGQGELILFTDCDLAYGLEMVGEMAADYFAHPEWDGIVGSRYLADDGYAGYTFLRKAMSKMYLGVLKVYGGLKLSDSQCGIKGFSKRAAREVFSRCEMDRFSFDFEAILLADALGYRIGEHPVTIVNHRESKIHIVKDSVRMLRDLHRIKKHLRRVKKELRTSQASV